MFEIQPNQSAAGTSHLVAAIAEHVIQTLGSPVDLIKVSVHPIGSDRYRVNVYAGETAAMARVANSFFLTADEQGNVTSSRPKIVRQYGLKGQPASPAPRGPAETP